GHAGGEGVANTARALGVGGHGKVVCSRLSYDRGHLLDVESVVPGNIAGTHHTPTGHDLDDTGPLAHHLAGVPQCLGTAVAEQGGATVGADDGGGVETGTGTEVPMATGGTQSRSEERRVGKEEREERTPDAKR